MSIAQISTRCNLDVELVEIHNNIYVLSTRFMFLSTHKISTRFYHELIRMSRFCESYVWVWGLFRAVGLDKLCVLCYTGIGHKTQTHL